MVTGRGRGGGMIEGMVDAVTCRDKLEVGVWVGVRFRLVGGDEKGPRSD